MRLHGLEREGQAWARNGAELREQRLRLGLTQKELAHRLGITEKGYKFETSDEQPPYGLLQHMARLLDERRRLLRVMAFEPNVRHTPSPAVLRTMLRLGYSDWTDRMVLKLWKDGPPR